LGKTACWSRKIYPVAILPEGETPGTARKPAPTTIGHPANMGASGPIPRFIRLPSLIELKLAAGRGQDDGDGA
jgi:hypothetical protein